VDRLRRLAVSDPLTGLSNYRQLAHALDVEIRRSSAPIDHSRWC